MVKIQYRHAIWVSISIILSSCAQDSLTSDAYTRGQARGEQSVRTGKLVNIRNVTIEGSGRGGDLIGGVGGGVLGNTIGGSRRANRGGTIGGAIVGGILGSHIKKNVESRAGIELTVKLDGGKTIAITQQRTSRETFSVGQRVRIIGSGSNTRVTY